MADEHNDRPVAEIIRDIRGLLNELETSTGAAPLTLIQKPSDVLYGARPIAEFLGVPEKGARHGIEAGEIPAFKIGKTVCARRSTLTAWLAEQERTCSARRTAHG